MKKLILMLVLAAFACSPLLTTEVSAAPTTIAGAKHHNKHHKKHHKHHKKHHHKTKTA